MDILVCLVELYLISSLFHIDTFLKQFFNVLSDVQVYLFYTLQFYSIDIIFPAMTHESYIPPPIL